MHLLNLTLPNFLDNLALDEALLLEAEEGHGQPLLRLWEWPHFAVVLGAAGKLAEDVHEENCRFDAVPIARRSSGGGTVLLGPGCLLFSLVLPYSLAEELTQISSSYRFILGKIREELGSELGNIELAGTSDLAIAGRKFSGNSQQRKRKHLLHHGSLLYNFDLSKVGRYLKPPERQPDYRQGREHQSFLMNLTLTREEIEAKMRRVWEADTESFTWPVERVKKLVEEKYSQENWVRRR